MKRPGHAILTALLLGPLFALCGCRKLVDSPYQLIKLPDGEILQAGGLDDERSNWILVDLMAVNFSERWIHSFGIDGQGGDLVDRYPGARSSGTPIALPKNPKLPFYIVLKWSDSEYEWLHASKDWGTSVISTNIYKTQFIKIDKPIPPDPEALLLIFYPKGRVECEVVGSKPGGDRRIDELCQVEGVR